MPTSNYNLNTPDEGSSDWHIPLNDNFTKIDSILDRIESNATGASGVRYASSFSGANGGEMIQAAIDDLPASGGTVVVGPEGPDASASAPRDTAWLMTTNHTPLEIPSNTTLINNGGLIYLEDNAGSGSDTATLISNATRTSTTGNNESISVITFGNGRWHHNLANNDRTDFAGGWQKKMAYFIGVDGLEICGGRWGPALDHFVAPEQITDARICNLQIIEAPNANTGRYSTDAVHLYGGCERVAVSNLVGRTYDDFLAIAPNETPHPNSSPAPVRYVVFDNIACLSSNKRLFRTVPSGGNPIEHIVLSNSVAKTNSDPSINIGSSAGTSLSDQRDIQISNVHISTKLAIKDPVQGLQIDGMTVYEDGELLNAAVDSDRLIITNCRVRSIGSRGQDAPAGAIRLQSTHNDVVIDNFVCNSERNDVWALGIDATATVARYTASNIVGSATKAMTVESGATVSDVSVRGVKVSDPNPEWDINADGIDLYDVTPIPDEANVTELTRIQGEIKQTENAESPNPTGTPGFINFTDSDDGSGTGIYYEDRDGNISSVF